MSRVRRQGVTSNPVPTSPTDSAINVPTRGPNASTPSKTTIFDIGSRIWQLNESGSVNPQNRIPITQGIQVGNAPKSQGIHKLTPNQAASLVIQRLRVRSDDEAVSDADIREGYQREVRVKHVRDVARRLLEGYPFPPILYGPNETGECEVIDGQHRALACVLSRVPILAACVVLSPEDRAKLFVGQRHAKAVSKDHLVLAGSTPPDLYVLDALTSNTIVEVVDGKEVETEHPWAKLVSTSSSKGITPALMRAVITAWCAGRLSASLAGTGSANDRIQVEYELKTFSDEKADELGRLLLSMLKVPRKEHPHSNAYLAPSIRAIQSLATMVITRRDNDKDRKRSQAVWDKYMHQFNWEKIQWAKTSSDYLMAFTTWFNRKAPSDLKVTL